MQLRLVLPAAGLKPFYESTEPINLDVISNAMVTVYRYDAQLTLKTVFLPCLLPQRSDGVKCCVVRALLTLTMEAPRLQHQAPMSIMYSAIAPVLRELFSVSKFPMVSNQHQLTVCTESRLPQARSPR